MKLLNRFELIGYSAIEKGTLWVVQNLAVACMKLEVRDEAVDLRVTI